MPPGQLAAVQQEVPAPTLAQLKSGLWYKKQRSDGSTVRNSAGTPINWLSRRSRYVKPVRAASSVGSDVMALPYRLRTLHLPLLQRLKLQILICGNS